MNWFITHQTVFLFLIVHAFWFKVITLYFLFFSIKFLSKSFFLVFTLFFMDFFLLLKYLNLSAFFLKDLLRSNTRFYLLSELKSQNLLLQICTIFSLAFEILAQLGILFFLLKKNFSQRGTLRLLFRVRLVQNVYL